MSHVTRDSWYHTSSFIIIYFLLICFNLTLCTEASDTPVNGTSSPSSSTSSSSPSPSSRTSDQGDLSDIELTSLPTPLSPVVSLNTASAAHTNESAVVNSSPIVLPGAIGLLGLARSRLQRVQQQHQQPSTTLPPAPISSPDDGEEHAVGPLSDLQSFLRYRQNNSNVSYMPFRLESHNPHEKLNSDTDDTGNGDHIAEIMDRIVNPHRNKQQSFDSGTKTAGKSNRLQSLQQRASSKPSTAVDSASDKNEASPGANHEPSLYYARQINKSRAPVSTAANGPPSHPFITQPMTMISSSPVTSSTSDTDGESEDSFDGSPLDAPNIHLTPVDQSSSGGPVDQNTLASPTPTLSAGISFSHKKSASTNKPGRSHYHHGSKRQDEIKKMTQASWIEKSKPNNVIPLTLASTASPGNHLAERVVASADDENIPPSRDSTVIFDNPARNSYAQVADFASSGQLRQSHSHSSGNINVSPTISHAIGHSPHHHGHSRPVTCCKTYYPPPPLHPPPFHPAHHHAHPYHHPHPFMPTPFSPLSPLPFMPPPPPLLPPPGLPYEPQAYYPQQIQVGASTEIDSDGQSKSSSSMAPTLSPSPSTTALTTQATDSPELSTSYGHYNHDHAHPPPPPHHHVLGESFCYQHPDPLLLPLYLKQLKIHKLLFPLTWKKRLLMYG